MTKLIRASLFKLFRDKTFFVTMIIGVILGILMILINYGIGEETGLKISGDKFFLSSTTIGNGFGLTVPINLIVFTIGEFTYGTIRNKVIAGLSKTKIYIALLVTGFVFTLILMGLYIALTVGIGSAIGGFNPNNVGGGEFIAFYILYILMDYIFVVSFSVFVATIFRVIGGTVTIAVVLFVFLNLIPLFTFLGATVQTGGQMTSAAHWSMWINPLYFSGFYSNDVVSILARVGATGLYHQTGDMIAAGILMPLLYSSIFIGLGVYLFNHRDIK